MKPLITKSMQYKKLITKKYTLNENNSGLIQRLHEYTVHKFMDLYLSTVFQLNTIY